VRALSGLVLVCIASACGCGRIWYARTSDSGSAEMDGGRDSGGAELDARTPADAVAAVDGATRDAGADGGLTCYCDRDGDRFFSVVSELVSGASCAAAGCQDAPGPDCCDSDPLSHPDATFHDYQSACGTWDWNCSGDVAEDVGCVSCSGAGSSGSSAVCPGRPTTCTSSSCRATTCGEGGSVVVAVASSATCAPAATSYPYNESLDEPNGWETCAIMIGVCIGDGCTTPGSCRCR